MGNNGIMYRMIFCVIVVFCLVLSGCDQLPMGESISIESEVSAGDVETELEVVTDSQGRPIYSIADYDWEIKNHSYGEQDNLYELSIDELNVSSGDMSIVALKAVDEQFVVICQNESLAAVVYMVNPLTMQITAFCDLPEGTYSDNGVRVNDKGEIEIWNEYYHELFVFNKRLQELDHIKIWNVRTSALALPVSSDHKYVYYKDANDGCLYAHQTETETRTRIFSDINVKGDDAAILLGLLKQDSCLAFRYYDKETKEYIYEVREIATGTVLYRDTGAIYDIETADGTYLLRHYEDGLSEILFGKEEAEVPQVISLKDYDEYEQTVTDIRTESVISCLRKEDAGEAQKAALFNLCLYDLKTGKRQCALDLHYIYELQDTLNCRMVYLKEADCVVCMIEDSTIRWLVWDLTKDSSKTGDDTDYIYQWQNPEQPDYERLTQLTQWAEQIGQKHGVEIYFGESVINNVSRSYENKVSTNVIRIEKMLGVLEKALDKYPEGMLAQLGEKSVQEGHLQFHLVSEIQSIGLDTLDNAIGYRSSIDGIPYIVLDINCVTELETTVYHEIFHAIEWEMNYDRGAFFDDDEWNYLNPHGFRYDKSYGTNGRSDNDDYTVGTDDVYFIRIYSKSFPEEDRATIMEYAMLDAQDEDHKNVESFGIQAKLKYICKEIRRGFDTTGWPEKTAWEMSVIE